MRFFVIGRSPGALSYVKFDDMLHASDAEMQERGAV